MYQLFKNKLKKIEKIKFKIFLKNLKKIKKILEKNVRKKNFLKKIEKNFEVRN